jgi:hypothetical protein
VSLAPGQSVRTRLDSGPGHTRLPGYARGRAGTIHALRGRFPFADEVARRGSAEPQPLYSVRFRARDLWGEQAGDHRVYVDLYESYLRPE